MARRRRKTPSLWPRLLIVAVIFLLAGVALGWIARSPANKFAGMVPEALADSTPTRKQLARMDRSQLEREVQRLERLLAAKEREISELTIQVRLLSEGSRTK